MCKNTHMLLLFLQDTIQAFRHTRNTWPDFLLLPHHLVLLHWELQVWKALPEHILVRAAVCVVRDSPNSLQKFLQRSPLINTHFPQSLMVCSEQTPRCWTALLCFGVIYTHGGHTELYLLLFNFCRLQHSQGGAGISSPVPPRSHHGQLKWFFSSRTWFFSSRTWSNHSPSATPEAFTPKNPQVTALIKVSAIDSICSQSKWPQPSLGFPNASDTHEMPLKLNLHTDAFSRTCLHSPHIHRSEAWGPGLLQPSKREVSPIPNKKVSSINSTKKPVKATSPSLKCGGEKSYFKYPLGLEKILLIGCSDLALNQFFN